MAQCTAKSKRSGEQCKKDAVVGRTKCHIHGGKSVEGAASGTFRTGRYSKYLPARLAGKYEQSQNDPDLLALKDEINAIDARIAELMGRIDTNEAGHWWRVLRKTYDEFLDARNKGDSPLMAKRLLEFGGIIDNGLTDYAIWDEITNAVEQRRRLVESERKRMVEQQQYVTAEQAMLLVSALIDVVTRHVSDRNTISAIYADVSKLTNTEGA